MSNRKHASTAISSQRRRQSAVPRHSLLAPSQALLSILASISPTDTAATALPTPDFLCPSLIPSTPPSSAASDTTIRKRTSSSRRVRRDVLPSPPAGTSTSSPFPVKYEQSNDGSWYPAPSWNLHGHKHPSTSTSPASTSTPTPTPPPDNLPPGLDTADDIASIPTSSNSATYTMPSDITDSLPTGWSPIPDRTKFYSKPVIIAFSLLLAIGISLVLGCTVLWHKNRRDSRDAERAKLARGDDEDKEEQAIVAMLLAKKEAAKKEKRWERWRDAARTGLKRRKRRGRKSQPEVHPDDHSLADASGPASPRRASMVSLRSEQSRALTDDDHHDTVVIPLSPTAELRPPSPQPPPPPSTPTLPPAYRRVSPVRRRPTLHTSPIKHDAQGSSDRPIVLPPDADEACLEDSVPGDSAPEIPVTAHVATDDKAVLERMHRIASEPRFGDDENNTPHAPQWEDERLEDFEDEGTAGPSSIALPPPPLLRHSHLPPPPQHHDHEDGDPGLPYYVPRFEPTAPCPSSPPFELDLHQLGVAASAPPEEDEEDPQPSAPPLDMDMESEGEETRHDDDRRSDHAPSRTPSPDPTAQSPSQVNGVLPRYEP